MKMFKVYMNVYLYVAFMNLANVNDLDVAMDMTGDQVASASSVFPPTSPFHLSHMLALCSYVCVEFTSLCCVHMCCVHIFDGMDFPIPPSF